MINVITHKDLPAVLYKYYAPPGATEWSEDNLRNRLKHGRIRLTDAQEVNDLFESEPTVVWDATVDDVYKKATLIYDADLSVSPQQTENQKILKSQFPTKMKLLKDKAKLFRRIKKDHRVMVANIFKAVPFYCLTAERSSILMWSHYASDHKGVCIGYDTRGFQFPAVAMPIRYRKKRLSMNATEALFNDTEAVKKLVFKALRTKSKVWNYEQEWRYFGLDIVNHAIYRANDEIEFDRKWICEVIFGERASEDTKSAVYSYIDDLSPRPIIYQASKSDAYYRIDLQKISNP